MGVPTFTDSYVGRPFTKSGKFTVSLYSLMLLSVLILLHTLRTMYELSVGMGHLHDLSLYLRFKGKFFANFANFGLNCESLSVLKRVLACFYELNLLIKMNLDTYMA